MACGTGIVASLVAEKVGPFGSVTGADLNAGMIEAARLYTPANTANIEWHQNDVTSLPFEDASLDMAFYQQGLQFFSDKPAALSELRRVLAPGGALILTVWSAISTLFAAVADSIGRFIGPKASTSVLSPFEFRDGEVIKALLMGAGFPKVEMSRLRDCWLNVESAWRPSQFLRRLPAPLSENLLQSWMSRQKKHCIPRLKRLLEILSRTKPIWFGL